MTDNNNIEPFSSPLAPLEAPSTPPDGSSSNAVGTSRGLSDVSGPDAAAVATTAQESNITERVISQFPSPPRKPAANTSPPKHARKTSLSIAIRPHTSSFVPQHKRAASSISQQTPNLAIVTTPSGDANFLTALAAQERRVLELREQLVKAEEQLMSLKKQWVSHEATRLRSDTRPTSAAPVSAILTPPLSSASDNVGSAEWIQEERKRRMSFGRPTSASGNSGGRRVFASSKTARPLSLVSPKSLDPKRMSDPTPEKAEELASIGSPQHPIPQRPTRSTTITDGIETIPEEASVRSLRESEAASLQRKSVALAADIREGLWTFFEDLRQATVGDEARPTQPLLVREPAKDKDAARPVSSHRPCKAHSPAKSGAGSKPPRRTPAGYDGHRETLIEVGGVMWKDDGKGLIAVEKAAAETLSRAPPEKKRKSRKPRVESETRQTKGQTLLFDEEDPWDNWDEHAAPSKASHQKHPSSSRSNSSASAHQDSPSTVHTTRSSSRSSNDEPPSRRDRAHKTQESASGFQWSNVTKRASQLRTSAMHLMDDWERSISEAGRGSESPVERPYGIDRP